jgi:lipopolysaccharide transport system ATP-binding protein
MSFDQSVELVNVSKVYPIYKAPADRLKQMIVPRLQRVLRLDPTTYYRDFWALRDISFTLCRGETIGIMGRNGSGKSTLLQIIYGVLPATAGSVSVNGRISALLELGTGFNPEFTGRENVQLSGQIKGFTRLEMIERFEEIAAFAEIGEFIDLPVKTYSSGMLVRLAYAVHAILDPDVLIIDEALAVGDARFQAKCLDHLRRLKNRGVSILFVSHDASSVRQFCDRAIWLDLGQLVEIGNVASVTSHYIEFMFAGTRSFLKHPADQSAAPIAPPVATPGNALLPIAELPPSFMIGAEKRKPLHHWGSHLGCIIAAFVTDENGLECGVFTNGQAMHIHIVARLPQDLDPNQIGVAFSIKNVGGLDLLIGRSVDATGAKFQLARSFHARFSVRNVLNKGQYLLTVAIENLAESVPGAISYIDYVDCFLEIHSVTRSPRYGTVVVDSELVVVSA